MKNTAVNLNTVNVNIQQLRYFLDLASTLSFSRTAENFNISQVAVTHQIQNLESKLGARLFARTKRHVDLTPAGRVFVEEAHSLIAKIEDAVDKTRSAALGISGTLSVGFTTGLSHTNVMTFLTSIKTILPTACLSYRRDTNRALEQGLKDRTYDLVFELGESRGMFPLPNESCLRVGSAPLCAVFPTVHTLAKKKSVTWDLLKPERIITYDQSMGDQAARPETVLAGNRNLPDVEMLLVSVAMGLGITVLPAFMEGRLADMSMLTFVPISGDGNMLDILARWREDNLSPLCQTLIQSLKNFISEV